ncbi:hypothetical protein [Lampropedia aestuarii]|uniref:hypothetical protein n=1 Tax=Lampropedia aestuarii TaxID=2562762 RepID=UPI002469644F|nr:hypothetical protein [Lampropedia aestuarii]MDH5855699.1 hypothetical protein [Lampropedia aestuarii]
MATDSLKNQASKKASRTQRSVLLAFFVVRRQRGLREDFEQALITSTDSFMAGDEIESVVKAMGNMAECADAPVRVLCPIWRVFKPFFPMPCQALS